MATTLKISNGDIVVNNSTGRAKFIGNNIGENDISKAKEKNSQDIQGALSIERIPSGAGAGIQELVGRLQGTGVSAIPILLNRQIREMFTAIIDLQRRRLSVRPTRERFSRIVVLRVSQNRGADSPTSWRFRLDIRTAAGDTLTQAGTVG